MLANEEISKNKKHSSQVLSFISMQAYNILPVIKKKLVKSQTSDAISVDSELFFFIKSALNFKVYVQKKITSFR